MAGAESFTVLAILEARDAASEIFDKVDESLDRFSETAKGAADSARDAGAAIDEALGRDVDVSDRLETATARLSAAQARGADAARALTDAESELRDSQAAAAGAADDDTAATARLVDADAALSAAQKDAAVAARGLRDAQAGQVTALKASADAGDENAASQLKAKEASDASGISLGEVGKVAGITALGMGVLGAIAIKTAGDFQSSTQHLVTDAGELPKNLAMVRAGILSISSATGTSASDITAAMYHIESGGLHGATGLDVARVAAEGAKIGAADLDTVSKTLIGTMNAYYGSTTNASNATRRSTSMMEEMTATVGSGDMRMQDLASSLSNVAPLAAASGIQFNQVGAAIATMTSQGMTAQQATQDLNNVIRNMAHPSSVASNEMRALGISALQVQKNLGRQQLTGTLDEYTQAILRNSKGGQVSLGYMKLMAPATQALAQGILSGKLSTEQLRQATYNLNPQQAKLLSLFNTSATSATGLKQSYTGAMAALTGGATGLNVALMLTGKNSKTFADNAAYIARQGKGAAAMTQSWAAIQGTFNQKLDMAKTGVENTGIAIGTALLPAATGLLSAVTKIIIPIAEWTARHKTLTEILFVGVTAIAATIAVIAVAKKAFDAVSNAVNTVKATLRALGIMSKETADTQVSSAETAAAAQESSSAEASAAMTADAEEVAVANEEAAAESAGVWGEQAILAIAYAAGWVVGQVQKVAAVVASNVAGAATTAGAWLASAASGVAGAAMWVAEAVGKVAVVVASNLAGAAVTAAAWVIANAAMLLGIGLIVVAVVAAVALIVTHWKQVSAFAKKAFDDVLHIVEDVIGWVKSHWPILLGILLGPIALAAALIATHYKQVLRVIEDAISWVKGHWPLLLAILTGPIGLAVLFIVKHFDQIRDGAASLLHDLESFFGSLPGRLLSALGNLNAMLYSSGRKIIAGLISGLMSMLGSVGSAIGSVASEITSHLPFSPAKKGPLSGAGSPDRSGRSIARMIATGMIAGTGDVTAASAHLAGAAALGRGGAGGGLTALGSGSGAAGAGGATIVIDVHGNYIMSDSDLNLLVRKLGPAVVQALGQAGVKVRMG